MKTINILLLFMALLASHTFAFPFAPAAGQSGSTAVFMNDAAFAAWADGYTDLQYGEAVSENWKTPDKALGQAVGTSYDIVCLGRGGQITLTFSQGIADGNGYDFAVFENSFSDTFLELGWVEVSSDGIHFTRFPNYSYTADPVGGFGGIDPTYIYGLVSKYKQGYGTPFDLTELQTTYDSIVGGTHSFANSYAEAFSNNFPYLDLSNIACVRIVDIVGDGLAFDAEGYAIYDPYPTVGSAGFDLDAIGVLNESIVIAIPYADWAMLHAVSTNGLGDADNDSVIDFQEYRMGGDPNLGSSAPVPTLGVSSNGTDSVVLEYALSRHALGIVWAETSTDLSEWTNAVPLMTEQWIDPDFIHRKMHLSADTSNRFYRLVFEE